MVCSSETVVVNGIYLRVYSWNVPSGKQTISLSQLVAVAVSVVSSFLGSLLGPTGVVLADSIEDCEQGFVCPSQIVSASGAGGGVSNGSLNRESAGELAALFVIPLFISSLSAAIFASDTKIGSSPKMSHLRE